MGRRWFVFFTIFLTSVCVALSMMKAPPIFPALMKDLGFTISNVGWIVSCDTLVGVLLAFPAAGLLNKLGVRTSLLIAGITMVIGSLMGSMATTVPFMLVSRVIEGMGYGFINVCGVAGVDRVMPKNVKGLAMGLFSITFPVGLILGQLGSPAIEAAFNWQTVWYFTAALDAVAAILIFFFYAEPPREIEAVDPNASEAALRAAAARLKPNWRTAILASIIYFVWSFVWAGGINGFYPTFLQTELGVTPQFAGFMAAVPNIVVLVLSPLGGWLSDRLHTRKWPAVIGLIVLAIVLTFGFSGTLSMAWVFIGLVTISAGILPPAIYAAVPESAKTPAAISLAMGIFAFCSNIGTLSGSATFGAAVSAFGWQNASMIVFLPMSVIGLVLALLIKEKRAEKGEFGRDMEPVLVDQEL
ncbi:MAG: nitrate/nitrite transporter [Coriobacteriia bacterium]